MASLLILLACIPVRAGAAALGPGGGTVGSAFTFATVPVAPSGSLVPGQGVTVTMEVHDAAGNPLPAGGVYLSLQSGNPSGTSAASASANGIALSSAPQEVFADAQGDVQIRYQVNNCCGGPLPTSGTDVVVAQNAITNPTVTTDDTYSYAVASPTGGQFVFSRAPLAPAGSLSTAQTVSLTLTAEDANGAPLPGAAVYLSFLPGGTSGTGAKVEAAGGPILNGTPQQIVADRQGQITLTYTTTGGCANCGLPSSGVDRIVAQNAASSPTVTSTDSYSYSTPVPAGGQFVFSASPIAGAGSLAAGKTVSLTLTAEDASGAPLPGAAVYLSFLAGNAEGTGADASASGAFGQGGTLATTPRLVVADAQGNIAVAYATTGGCTNCGSLPISGVDRIVAQNAATSPSVAATDSYAYSTAVPAGGQFIFSPAPIAPAGSLSAGQTVSLTLTAEDASGAALPGAAVYLSFLAGNAEGTGADASASGAFGQGGTLGATPRLVVADAQGHIAVVYAATGGCPNCGGLPTSGVDRIVAQNVDASLSVTAAYSYSAPIAPVGRLVFSTSPVAAAGSLAAGKAVSLSLTAEDASGAPLPGAAVYLSFLPGNTGGTAAEVGVAGGPSLNGTPRLFVADALGQISLSYAATGGCPNCGGLPTSGVDQIVAQNAASSPTVTSTDSYSYSTPVPAGGQFIFSPSPVAAAGTLAAGRTVSLTVTAEDASGAPLPGAAVYLSFLPGSTGGTAAEVGVAGGPSLNGTPRLFVADALGQISLSYAATGGCPNCGGLPTSGVDQIVAQNAAGSPTVTSTDSYSYSTPVPAGGQFIFSPSPVSAAGTLAAAQTVSLTLTAEDASGAPLAGAAVYLRFVAGNGAGTGADATASGAFGLGGALGGAPRLVVAGAQGQIALTYTTTGGCANCGGLPANGSDAIVAQNTSVAPALVETDSYAYAYASAATTVGDLSFGPSPIAAPGSLGAGAAESVTLTADDQSGHPLADASVYLSFAAATGGGKADVAGTPLTTAATLFTTNAGGQLSITYQAPTSLPPGGGTDTITAQNASPGATVVAADSYTFAAAVPAGGQFLFNPSPVAAAGTLTAGETVPVTVSARDASGRALPGAKVYLSFAAGNSNGSAATVAVGSTALTATPEPFVADAGGQVHLQYRVAATGLPTAGADAIMAADTAASPTVTATVDYSYGAPQSAGGQYLWSPGPIAPAGALAPASDVTVSLMVYGNTDQPVPHATAYLSFQPTAGGGSATVGTLAGAAALTATSQAFVADGNGLFRITYATPASLPMSGSDLITAQNAATGATVRSSDVYAFSRPVPSGAQMLLSPSPIATPGTLGADASRTVTLKVESATGAAQPHALVFLSFAQAPGGGSVTAAGIPLGTTPAGLVTDAQGEIALTYTAPAVLPAGGTDTISVADASSVPTNTVVDSYSFAVATPAGAIPRFAAAPIAPAGSMGPGTQRAVTLSVLDPNGSLLPGGEVFLSFAAAPQGGSASVGPVPLTATLTPFTADATGHITLTYTAPGVLPSQGVDTLNAANAASGATVTATDSYTFSSPLPAGGTLLWSPAILAPPGTLSAGAAITATLTALDAHGSALPAALVYLSVYGIGQPAVGQATVGGVALAAVPQPFVADASGHLAVTYTAAATAPTGVPTDVLTAQNAPAGAPVFGSASYTYGALSIETQVLPEATPGQPYVAALNAAGGAGPYVWSLVSGSLPPGLSLDPAGTITGTPTTAGVYLFGLRAADTRGSTVQTNVAIPVAAPWLAAMAPSSGPGGTKLTLTGSDFGTVVGEVYFTQGLGAPITALPLAGTWSDTGAQVLVPTVLDVGTVSVAVYDAETGRVGSSLPFQVTAAPPPPPPTHQTGDIAVQVVSPVGSLTGLRLLAWSPSAGSGAVVALGAPGTYTLAGLGAATDYSIRIVSTDGRTLANQGPLTVSAGATVAETLHPALPATLSVTVTDPAGNPVAGVGVTLTDAGDGSFAASGQSDSTGSLAQVPALQSLLSNHTLSAVASVGQRFYQEPAPQSITLQPGGNNLRLVLQPIPQGMVAGAVTDAATGDPVADAVVTVSEGVSDGRTFTFTVTTDTNGNYSLTTLAGQAQIQAATPDGSYSFAPTSIAVPGGQTLTKNLGMIHPGPGQVTIQLFTQYLGQPLQGPLPVDWRVAVHFQLTVTGPRGQQLGGWNYPVPIEGLPGEPVHVCVNGSAAQLPSACQDVQLDADGNATAKLVLQQQGVISGQLLDGATGQPITDGWSGQLYQIGATGGKTLVQDVGGDGAQFSVNVPAAGSYEVDVEQGAGTAVLTGTIRASVQAAQVANVGNVILAGVGSFAGQAGDGVLAEPATVVPGQVLTIRAAYLNAGSGAATGAEALLDVPGGTTLVPGSVVVNGAAASGRVSGSLYQADLGTVAAGGSGFVRYQVQIGSGYVAPEVDASVRVAYTSVAGVQVTEVLGSVAVPVQAVTLQVPQELGVAQTTAQGEAPADSTVSVYDGAALLGQTTAGAGGYWQLPITLPVSGYAGYHLLQAQAAVGGRTLSSLPVSVHYDPSAPQLQQVCMHQTDGRLVCVVPDQGVAQFPYVWVPGMPFTFDVTFNDPSAVDGVTVALGGPGGAVADATLGSDGVFHATLVPGYGGWSGVYVGYHVQASGQMLAQAPPSTLQQVQQMVPPRWSDLQLTSVTPGQTGAHGQVAGGFSLTLPQDGNAQINAHVTMTPVASFTPTADEQAAANQSGWPIYGMSIANTVQGDRGTLTLQFLFPVPVSATGGGTATVPTDAEIPPISSVEFWQQAVEQVNVVNDSGAVYNTLNYGLTAQSLIQSGLDNWDGENNIGKLNTLYDLLDGPGAKYLSNSEFTDYTNQLQNMETNLQEQAVLDGALTATSFLAGGKVFSNFLWGQAFNLAQGKIDGVNTDALNALRDAMESDIQRHISSQNPPPPGTKVANPTPIMDPSGYVYEGVTTNRLAGVTATILQQGQGAGGLSSWDAAAFGQANPQVTDPQGHYGWDVPAGNYQVAFDAAGYQPASSAVVTVPPPQDNIDAGLIPQSAPAVASVTAAPDGRSLDVAFTQYVLASTLDGSTVSLATYGGGAVTGTVAPLAAVVDAAGAEVALAARFTPSSPLAQGQAYTVTTSQLVQNFAGNPMAGPDVRVVTVPQTPPAPVVTGIAPAFGSPGTVVTIHGTGFTGATAVSFGGQTASSFTVAADGVITATVPVGAGTVNVTVVAPGGTSGATPVDQFGYTPPSAPAAPQVTGLSVSQGPAAGGTSVTVTGGGFSGATGVSFGPNPAPTFTVNSDTQITAVSPPGAGSVMVAVTTPVGTSQVASGAEFGYLTTVAVPVAADGGQVGTGDGQGLLVLPAGALPPGTTVSLQELSAAQVTADAPLPAGATLVGAAVRLSLGIPGPLAAQSTLTLGYNAAAVPAGGSTGVYGYSGGAWVPLASTSDGAQAVAMVTQPGDYAVLAVPGVGQSGGGGAPSGASGPANPGVPLPSMTSVGPTGGTLTSADGTFLLSVPAGDIPAGGSLSLQESCPSPAGIPADTVVASCVFTLSGSTLGTPSAAVIRYNASVLRSLPASRLSLYALNSAGWSFLPTAIASGGTATAYVTGPEILVVLADTQPFPDVPTSHWAAAAIDAVAAAALADGYPDGTFQPDAVVTRAEFTKMLVLALGLPVAAGQLGFGDVPADAWYAPYVATAVRAGLVQGTSAGVFDAQGPLTREEMAVLLTRALKLTGQSPLAYTDGARIDPWARGAVAAAVADGLLRGFPDSSFQPLASSTRAQAAQILARVIASRAPRP